MDITIKKITVFTPTFNREHTLERLYNSLKMQSFKDFEWLIIDDGSTDNTKLLFKKWAKEENEFPIRYYVKENGGKHTAINYGLEKSNGKLFLTADSDDYLTSDALQKVNDWELTLPENEKFCGVIGNMGSSSIETPNTNFPENYRDASLLERYPEFSEMPIDGERVFVFYTEIHRQYRYPEFDNEKFITEAVAWNRMANEGYKMRLFNDIIYIYKYLPNGLTLSGSKLFYDNPKGFGLWLKEKAEFGKYTLSKKLNMFYGYYFSQKDNLSRREIATNIGAPYSLITSMSYYYRLRSLIRSNR